MDIDPERVARSPFVVGGVGAAISAWKFPVPGSNFFDKLGNTIAGAACAGYVGPMVNEWLKMESETYRMGAAFILGIMGMSLAAAILKAIADTPLAQIAGDWLRGILPKRKE